MAEPDTRRQTDDDAPARVGPVMKDPITGTTPTGPITTGSARAGRGNWGLAARWFLLALLLLAILVAVWFMTQ